MEEQKPLKVYNGREDNWVLKVYNEHGDNWILYGEDIKDYEENKINLDNITSFKDERSHYYDSSG